MVSFDTNTTTFSPEGKIFQVEYALKAVSSAGLCFAMKGKDSIVVFIEQKIQSKLLDKAQPSVLVSKPKISSIPSKFYKIDSHFCAATAGFAPDADRLISHLREFSLNSYTTYGTPVSISSAARKIADLKQKLTQRGGNRPFAASLIYFGLEDGELTLLSSQPSGYFGAYKAVAIGNESSSVMSELDALMTEQSKDHSVQISDLSPEELFKTGMSAVMKTIGSGTSTLTPGKIEAYVVKARCSDMDVAHFDWQDEYNVGMEPIEVSAVPYDEITAAAAEVATRQQTDQRESIIGLA